MDRQRIKAGAYEDQRWEQLAPRQKDIERIGFYGPNNTESDRMLVRGVCLHLAAVLQVRAYDREQLEQA